MSTRRTVRISQPSIRIATPSKENESTGHLSSCRYPRTPLKRTPTPTLQDLLAPAGLEVIEGVEVHNGNTYARTLDTIGQPVLVQVPKEQMPSMADLAIFEEASNSSESSLLPVSEHLVTITYPILTGQEKTLILGHIAECPGGLCLSCPEEKILHTLCKEPIGEYGRMAGYVLPVPVVSLADIQSDPKEAEKAIILETVEIQRAAHEEAGNVIQTTNDLSTRTQRAAKILQRDFEDSFQCLGKEMAILGSQDLALDGYPPTPQNIKSRGQIFQRLAQDNYRYGVLVAQALRLRELNLQLEKILEEMAAIGAVRAELFQQE